MNEITDRALDAYYARDYYGPGTHYFEPPDFTESEIDEITEDIMDELEEEDRTGRCLACGKPMKRTGIWVCCEHCGRLQVWPTEYDHRREDAKKLRAAEVL